MFHSLAKPPIFNQSQHKSIFTKQIIFEENSKTGQYLLNIQSFKNKIPVTGNERKYIFVYYFMTLYIM